MADTKLTGLTEQTVLALDDWLYSVDKSDTTDDAAGSSRKFAYSTLLQYTMHGLTEIAITDATTAPTIGRMHAYKATSADRTVVLPTAASQAGKIIGIRITTDTTKLFTFDGNSTETIDGALTRIMWAGESAYLISDGSNWFKIAGKTIPTIGRLIATGSQTPTRSTFVNLTLPSAQIDNTGLLCDTSAYKITVKRPGYYYFACGTSIITPTDFATFIIALYKNATSTYRVFRNGISTSGSNTFSGVGSQVLNLAAGDYINGQIYYYDPTTNRSTEYINPDSVSFLECTEIPTW